MAELESIARRDSSVTSKLKCKPCGLFFRDNGYDGDCPRCGQHLRRVKVFTVKPEHLKVISGKMEIGAKNDKHKKG